MTDRAEIERLLNATGRTLESVTKVETGYESRRNGKTMSVIMHQSDVIELLVGALRDALEKPMQKPLTLEELRMVDRDSFVWEERKTELNRYFERTNAMVLAFLCSNSKGKEYKYGHSLRAWKKMPTDEEMEAAAWET